MKFLLLAAVMTLSLPTFARELKCTRDLQIKTLEAYISQELGEAYVYNKDKNSFISVITENDLTLDFDSGYVLAEGYVGVCSGGNVWGRIGIKISRKVLASGLCEIKDTVSSGMCED